MYDIDKRFANVLEPRIVTNFIAEDDREFLKNYIEVLSTTNDLQDGNANNGRKYNSDYPEIALLAKKYFKKVIEEYPTSEPIYTHVMGLIKYVEGDWMEVHWDRMDENCDSCVLSSVMYLNDDYYGGEIVFPNLLKQYRPEAGSWISYPSLDRRFDHGVNTVTSGVRYALAWCFTTNLEKAFKPYLITDRIE